MGTLEAHGFPAWRLKMRAIDLHDIHNGKPVNSGMVFKSPNSSSTVYFYYERRFYSTKITDADEEGDCWLYEVDEFIDRILRITFADYIEY